jgi:hypothetical protein
LNELRGNPLFKVVCYGGLGTILMRCCIWACTLYITTVKETTLPRWLYWMLVTFNSGVFGLEVYWFNLYLSNLKAARKIALELKQAGKAPPSMWSVMQ